MTSSIPPTPSNTPSPTVKPRINEFMPNPAGTDAKFQKIELKGSSGKSFTGWLVSAEGNRGSSTGSVIQAEVISGTFNANWLLTVSVPDLTDSTFTYVLSQYFTGSVSITDIDMDDDGTVDDLSTFGYVYDAISVPASTNSQYLYGSELGGTNLKFIGGDPRLVFRDRNTDELYSKNKDDGIFDADGIEYSSSDFNVNPAAGTFGAVNPVGIFADI